MKLHYAKVGCEEIIQDIEVDNIIQVMRIIHDSFLDEALVCLIHTSDNEIFISSSKKRLINYMQSRATVPTNESEIISIHEYQNFEEAYEVALMLKEISPLCYRNSQRGNDRFLLN